MTFTKLAFFSASLLLGGAVVHAGTQAPTRTVKDGVYTADQAARGEQLYKVNCSSCHYQTEFTGEGFVTRWAEKPLYELFDLISDSMPEDRPGSLPIQNYADVMSYFLKLNNYPTGPAELEGAAEPMRDILMEKMKK